MQQSSPTRSHLGVDLEPPTASEKGADEGSLAAPCSVRPQPPNPRHPGRRAHRNAGRFAMKAKLLLLILWVGGCSYADAEFIEQDSGPSQPDADVLNRRDLGWVVYEDGGRWTEASAAKGGPGESVVQLGMVPVPTCKEDDVCFDAPLVTELRDDGNSLCTEALGEFQHQHATGRFTGVIVRWSNKSILVTTRHPRGKRGHLALRSHDLTNAQVWPKHGRTLDVPKEFVTVIDGPARCDPNLDLMIGGLPDDWAGVELAKDDAVIVGAEVQAFTHPFGLPMKTARATITACERDFCWIKIETAVGASGGPVFTKDGQLAGVLLGSGVESRVGNDHEHRGRAKLDPCGCSPRGGRCYDEGDLNKINKCESGQRFVRSSAIAEMLSSRGGEGCGSGGWLAPMIQAWLERMTWE